MRIIKVEIQKIYGRSIQLVKYAISLNYKQHSKVKDFIAYIKKICKLNDLDYELEYDGFIIPNNDKTRGLQEKHIYKLKLVNKRAIKNYLEKQDMQGKVETLNEDVQEKQEKNRGKNNEGKKSKLWQKKQKISRKKKQFKDEDSSISASQQSQQSQSSQSSSSSESQESSSDSILQKPEKIVPISTKNIISNQIAKKSNLKKEKLKKKSSSSSSSQELPTCNVVKQPKEVQVILPKQKPNRQVKKNEEQVVIKAAKKKQTDIQIEKHYKEYQGLLQKSQKIQQKKKVPVVVEKKKAISSLAKKKVIEDDSSSQSDPTPQFKPKQKQPKVNLKQGPKKQIKASSPKEIKLMPPAIRNKIYQKKFQDHKQNQWLIVDKEKLKLWSEKGNKEFCKPDNKIRYKIIQFDEEKFVPVKSDWIYADVKQISAEGKVLLGKVEQVGNFKQSLQIFEFNMDELQIFKPLATKEQLQCLNSHQNKQSKDEQPKAAEISNEQKLETNTNNQSIQKFICGQANYYFSDKNYNFDLFMQMHANRDPQKYLNLRILLNFPKIKKFIRDEDKLIQYLKEDDKYEQRHYQIDYQRKLIRKRGVFIQGKPEQQEVKKMDNENKEADLQADKVEQKKEKKDKKMNIDSD